jgi:uncharacterized delta-60 repeat protein
MQKNLLFGLKLTAIALVIFIQTLETRGAWGDFDTSFGFQGAAGEMITGYNPRSVALLPEGKRILITGYRTTSTTGDRFFLRRYLPNGQLDTAFGTNGAAIGPEANSLVTDYRGDAIAVLANGKIAVAGWANGNSAVWQFNSNGKVDKTFGVDGLQVLTDYPIINSGYPEINIQNGKLLLTLRKYVGSDYRVALVRLTSIGTLDTHFGNSGESLTGIYGAAQGSDGTVVEADGKIVIAGVKYYDTLAKGLERKLANGQADLTFLPSTTHSWGNSINPGLVKMVNGKYAMRGMNPAQNGTVTLALEKFSSAGIFESSLTPYNGLPITDCPEVFTNQSDGKLLTQFAGLLFRTNAELTPGSTEINYCSNISWIDGISRAALQPDDKIVAAGVFNNDLMLVRLLPN